MKSILNYYKQAALIYKRNFLFFLLAGVFNHLGTLLSLGLFRGTLSAAYNKMWYKSYKEEFNPTFTDYYYVTMDGVTNLNLLGAGYLEGLVFLIFWVIGNGMVKFLSFISFVNGDTFLLQVFNSLLVHFPFIGLYLYIYLLINLQKLKLIDAFKLNLKEVLKNLYFYFKFILVYIIIVYGIPGIFDFSIIIRSILAILFIPLAYGAAVKVYIDRLDKSV